MQVLEVLPQESRVVKFSGTYQVLKVLNRRLIGGYASVEVRDKEGELITVEALKDALQKFMAAKEYRDVMVMHSNIQVGKVLAEKVIDSEGNPWQTHVDEVGLFVVCEIDRPINQADRVWEAIEKEQLRSFSIAGEAIERAGPDRKTIVKLELHEITICAEGMNAPAKFKIIKSALTDLPEDARSDLMAGMGAVIPDDSILVKQKGRTFLILPSQVRKDETGTKVSVTGLEQRSDSTNPGNGRNKKMSEKEAKNAEEKKQDEAPPPADEKPADNMMLEIKALLEKVLAALGELKARKPDETAPAETEKEEKEEEDESKPPEADADKDAKEEMAKTVREELKKMFPAVKKSTVPGLGLPPGGELKMPTDEELVKMSWEELEDFNARTRKTIGGQ